MDIQYLIDTIKVERSLSLAITRVSISARGVTMTEVDRFYRVNLLAISILNQLNVFNPVT